MMDERRMACTADPVPRGDKECLYFEVFSDPATTSPSSSSTNPVAYSWMENWTKPVEWLMSVRHPTAAFQVPSQILALLTYVV